MTFWETTPLHRMTRAQWESLCDGCGKCCLLKWEDEETGELAYTRIACRLFDPQTRRCRDYARRLRKVPGCVRLTPQLLAEHADWMPATCAYRRLHEGRGLPDWHPLRSGDPDSVARAGHAVRDTVSEAAVEEDAWEDYVIDDLSQERAP